jgi:hypothetical protein
MAMSALLFVVLVSDKPAIMARFIVPLIVVVPVVFLLSLALRVAQLVFRTRGAVSAGRRITSAGDFSKL